MTLSREELANDATLQRLLAARSAEEREAEIEYLLVTATPFIRDVLRRTRDRAGDAEVDDVVATVHVRLLTKLRALAEGRSNGIGRFEDYVAMTAYNARNDVLRRRNARAALKYNVRRFLRGDARLSLVPNGGRLIASLRAWSDRQRAPLEALPELAPTPAMLGRNKPADAIAAILESVGRPVTLDALVERLAVWWSVTDDRSSSDEGPVDGRPQAHEQLEMRQYLERLWREILDLRPLQRGALLLNLRDDRTVNVASLLITTGIATFPEVAAAVGMSEEALTAIWNDLPLGDLQIGRRFGLTRQQVINLRKSARERLARRMAKHHG